MGSTATSAAQRHGIAAVTPYIAAFPAFYLYRILDRVLRIRVVVARSVSAAEK